MMQCRKRDSPVQIDCWRFLLSCHLKSYSEIVRFTFSWRGTGQTYSTTA
jgi:hypothetical protein